MNQNWFQCKSRENVDSSEINSRFKVSLCVRQSHAYSNTRYSIERNFGKYTSVRVNFNLLNFLHPDETLDERKGDERNI